MYVELEHSDCKKFPDVSGAFPVRVIQSDFESLIEMIFADDIKYVGVFDRCRCSNIAYKRGIRAEIEGLLQKPVFDRVCHVREFPSTNYDVKDFGDGSLQKVFNEIRQIILSQYVEEGDLFAKVQEVIPDCDRKSFNDIVNDRKFLDRSFWWLDSEKCQRSTYYDKDVFDDVIEEYRMKVLPVPQKKKAPSVREYNGINAAGYMNESHQIRDVRVYRERVSLGDFSDIEFCISSNALDQKIEIQVYADLTQRPYSPWMSKRAVLKRVMRSFIKLHKDLEKQQKSEIPNPKREAKIKSIIMSQITTLKQQSGYFKQYFNKNVDVIVERYRHGDFMSVAELEACFDLSDKPVCPKVIPGNHGIIR